MYVSLSIYIYRERERCMYIYTYTYIYIYIYICSYVIRLTGFAALLATFEEHASWTGSVRRVVPP